MKYFKYFFILFIYYKICTLKLAVNFNPVQIHGNGNKMLGPADGFPVNLVKIL